MPLSWTIMQSASAHPRSSIRPVCCWGSYINASDNGGNINGACLTIELEKVQSSAYCVTTRNLRKGKVVLQERLQRAIMHSSQPPRPPRLPGRCLAGSRAASGLAPPPVSPQKAHMKSALVAARRLPPRLPPRKLMSSWRKINELLQLKEAGATGCSWSGTAVRSPSRRRVCLIKKKCFYT